MIYSEFPDAEYRDRYQRLAAQGAERGIDAFVFTDEENLRYFAGGPLTDAFVFRTDYMAVLIPTDTDKPPSRPTGARCCRRHVGVHRRHILVPVRRPGRDRPDRSCGAGPGVPGRYALRHNARRAAGRPRLS